MSLQIPSARQPVWEMVNDQPQFTRPWFLFFQTVYQQLGSSPITTLQDLQQNPVTVQVTPDPPEQVIASLLDHIHELSKRVDALAQGTNL